MADKSVPFHGILAIGNTKDEAVSNYRKAAIGQSVSAYVDENRSFSFVSNAGTLAEMFNPKTGDLDLEETPTILAGLEFQTEASDAQEVNYFVCKSGCGAHMVYDSEDLVKFCPVCTSAATEEEPEAETEEVKTADAPSTDTLEVKTADEKTAPEVKPADEKTAPEVMTEATPEVDAVEEVSDLESSENEPIVVAASSKEEAATLYAAQRALASGSTLVKALASSDMEAHYSVCSSGDCGCHVMASVEDYKSCPVCASDLVEPQSDTSRTVEVDLEPAEPSMGAEDDLGTSEDDMAMDEDDMAMDEDDMAMDEDDMAMDEDDMDLASMSFDDDEIVEEVSVELDALDQIDDSAEDASSDLDMSYSSSVAGQPMWTAYYQGRPVATLVKSESKHLDLFDNGDLGRAAYASAKHAGVVNTLRELGFKAIKYPMSLSRYEELQVETALAAARADVAADKKQYQERMLAALATSAIGLNRGFFAGATNPLKDALHNALSSAGVRNPEVLIHNAFKVAGDAYHKQLFAKACDILEKPAEVQESLAKAVLEMNYIGTASVSSGTVEDRLANLGSAAPRKESVIVAEASTAPQSFASKLSSAVSSLGRRY